MKHMLIKAVGLVAVTAMPGCATVYRVSESAPEPVPVPAPGRPAVRNPAVSVKAKSADNFAHNLAASMQASVERDLAARGFDVNAKGKVDKNVSMSVSRHETARLSDWRLYEGVADVRIMDASSGKLLASNLFKATGERAVDERKAEATVDTKLSRQVSQWLGTALPAQKVQLPPGPPPPGHVTATIAIRPASLSEDPMDVLRVQRRFMDVVAGHPGVVSCTLAGESPAYREFAFRVVYEPNSFPLGLLNTIVLDMPYLGDGVKLEITR